MASRKAKKKIANAMPFAWLADATAAALYTTGHVRERLTVKAAVAALGSALGGASKMPGATFGLSAADCKTGAKLAKVKGSICASCYADPSSGNYSYPSVKTSHARRLEALTTTAPDAWVAAMVSLIERDGRRFFRWHDSGDVQSLSHLHSICEVARALPNVMFWLPTKEYDICRTFRRVFGAFPANLTVRVSAPMIDQDAPPSVLALGLPYSIALTHGAAGMFAPVAGAVPCHAYADPKKPAVCGECRACWEPSVKVVAYPVH